MSLDDLVDEAERNGGNASRIFHRTYLDTPHLSETQAGPIVETTAYPLKRTLNCLPRSTGSWIPVPAPRQMFRRSQFKHLIKMWSFPKHHTIKGGIGLTAGDSFSPAFEKAIGSANTTNIYGLDDDLTSEAIFEALVEREATNQYRSGSNTYLDGLLNIDDGYRGGMVVSGELEPDGKLLWRINHGTVNKGAWLDLTRTVFSLSRLDALATLAKIVNMDIERLQTLSSDRHPIELNGSLHSDEDVPKVLHLSRFPAGSACAELVGNAYIYGNAGQVIGAILSYRLNGKDFCLPATVGKKILCMGKYKPTAHFLNQHLMDKYPGATILLCQDMRTALAVQMLFNQTRENNPDAKIIVTAHLGDDLSVLPWNYFYGHEVVFVPAPTKQCMAMVKMYRDHVTGVQAKSFRVYSGFLLHSQLGCNLKEHVECVTDAEEELLRKAVWLDTVERPLWLAQQVISEAVSYDEFMDWGQRLDIFKAPKEQSNCGMVAPLDSLSLFQSHIDSTVPQVTNFKDVTTRQVFVPGGITLLHGLKDSGKSITCITTVKSIISGGVLFEVISSGELGNILYMDSETPQDLLTERLAQFGLLEELNNHLFMLSKFDHKATDSVFSIMDQTFRDQVEKILHEQNCHYLVLDNLTSLMDAGSLYQATAVSQLFNWLERLAQQGLGIILVSHTHENASAGTAAAKARGSQEFSIRAHTEIVLVRSTEILEKKLGTETVRHAAAQDGLTAGICFKVCKAACVLQKKTFWLHLPFGASEWTFLAATGADGKEIMLPMEDMAGGAKLVSEGEGSPVVSANVLSQPTTEQDLSPDERRVVEALRKESANRDKVQKQTDFAEDKTLALLRSLISKGLVVKKGQGKATYYSLKSNL